MNASKTLDNGGADPQPLRVLAFEQQAEFSGCTVSWEQWDRSTTPSAGRSPVSSRSRRSSRSSGRPRTLGPWAVALVVYFNVSGGPWGSEDIVGACGPLPGFVGIFAFMLLWAVPLALITAELATAFPEDGGYNLWVTSAFGEFWGFQESYLSFVSGVVDSAMYPVLAYQTAVRIFGDVWGVPMEAPEDSFVDTGGANAYLCKLVFVCVFTLPNLVSTRAVGLGLGLAFALVSAPFLAFSVMSLLKAGGGTWSNLLQVREGAGWQQLGGLLQTLYWNWNGIDSASTCAGEVRDPSRSFVVGIASAVLLIFASYVVPLSVAVANGRPAWDGWEAGSLSSIADVQVGRWMAAWFVLASFVGSYGQYAAELFEQSAQVAGLADAGMAPAFLGWRLRGCGTPWVAISIQMVLVSLIVGFPFAAILTINNCCSVLATLLELAAFLQLRRAQPDLARPFRVPLRAAWSLALFLLFPFGVGAAVFFSTFSGEGVVAPALSVAAAFIGGPALHWALARLRPGTAPAQA